MSQMFETDIGSLLPDDNDRVARLEARVAALEHDQLRFLGLLEQMVSLDKSRSQFDVELGEQLTVLRLRVLRLEREAELDKPQPFPGQDDDFGLAPKPKKGGN